MLLHHKCYGTLALTKFIFSTGRSNLWQFAPFTETPNSSFTYMCVFYVQKSVASFFCPEPEVMENMQLVYPGCLNKKDSKTMTETVSVCMCEREGARVSKSLGKKKVSQRKLKEEENIFLSALCALPRQENHIFIFFVCVCAHKCPVLVSKKPRNSTRVML